MVHLPPSCIPENESAVPTPGKPVHVTARCSCSTEQLPVCTCENPDETYVTLKVDRDEDGPKLAPCSVTRFAPAVFQGPLAVGGAEMDGGV